ncbi:MAG: helix-turn-helix transcriptional regulator [Fimbriimonadaceae bacterium]|nr:MAG: helix-turn-helix transcriptional regulator [Fimbriimonadaceae bacterium]
MPNETQSLDQVFRALSHATRRDVIEQLGRGPASMTALAEPHDMALPSFLQHLQVLEDAGMISSQKEGRVRTFQLEAPALISAEHWIDARRREWEKRLDQLDNLLISLNEKQKT